MVRVGSQHADVGVNLLVGEFEVQGVLLILLLGVLVPVHLAVSLHEAEQHQLKWVELQLLGSPEAQIAPQLVESAVYLVVETN